MNRRPIIKALGTGVAALVGSSLHVNRTPSEKRIKKIKPQRLRKGDLVTLVAPGGPVNDKKIDLAVKNISEMGFKIKHAKNLRAQRGHMAGTDKQRLEDLHTAFSDTETKAVWCVRGGDGCNRLLPHLDYKLIKRNAKALIGFSDITAL